MQIGIENMNQTYYWIIIGLLIIGLVWSKYRKRGDLAVEDSAVEGFLSEENDKQKLSELLGLLLDNQTIANQILIDFKIKSISDLATKNRERIQLKLKPILQSDQYQIILKYLLLRDVYFIGQPSTQIIKFARNPQPIQPDKLFSQKNLQAAQLQKFRHRYHLDKNLYFKYNWITDKIKTYVTDYGFQKVTKSFEHLKEIFGQYWEGQKYLEPRDFKQLERYTTLYSSISKAFYFKLSDGKWYSFQETNLNLILRLNQNTKQENQYWFGLTKKTGKTVPPTGSYVWIRTSSLMSLNQLYRKVDELSQNGYFVLNPRYDQAIGLQKELQLVSEQIQRLKLLKKWVGGQTKNLAEQKMILENICNDLNHRALNIFDDLATYLIFHQYLKMSDLHLEKNPESISLDAWWSAPTLDALLIKASNLGQCYLPAKLSMAQVQKSPPIYKYVFNKNLYHTFWEPINIYINQLEDKLESLFKTSNPNEIIPVARFCIFNNPSLREYLKKYITCHKTKCSTDLESMKEPERCGQLKLKYQELISLKQKYKCLFKSSTLANPSQKKKEGTLQIFEGFQESPLEGKLDLGEVKINKMMGFSNSLLLDIVEFALKMHQCQTNDIKIQDCQDLAQHVDINDQKTDQDLGKVEVSRQSDLFNIYDQQMDEYHKILHNQEMKKLKPLNLLANLNEREQRPKVNLLQNTADDFHSIVNDLTKLPSQVLGSNLEDFDNQLENNLDLSESSFQDYQSRLERQLKGIGIEKDSGILEKGKKTGYQIFKILTKDGRMMTSGFFILVISLALYFIDISA